MRTSTRTRLVAAIALTTAVTAGCSAEAAPASVAGPTSSTAAEPAPSTLGAALPLCTDLPDIPTARCGELTVPLYRADPGAGTTTVGFALVPRTDTAQPSLGTIVPNPGGPGGGTIDQSGALFAGALEPLLDRRDLLLIDPRGVGRSDPLTCSALTGPARVLAPSPNSGPGSGSAWRSWATGSGTTAPQPSPTTTSTTCGPPSAWAAGTWWASPTAPT